MTSYSNNCLRRLKIPSVNFMRHSSEGSSSRPPRIIHGQNYPEWRTRYSERQGEWSSKFKLFTIDNIYNPEYLTYFHRPKKTWVEWWTAKKEEVETLSQEYSDQRHEQLGNDLATAHFICYRGGTVRFLGKNEWIKKDPSSKSDDFGINLPDRYKDGYTVEMIDCENMEYSGMRYEGLANLVGLRGLKWLSLKGNKCIDDWAIDRITGLTHETLEYLDLRDCSISYKGLIALYRMSHLRVLVISSELVSKQEEVNIVCAMLEELYPDLLVKID